MKQEIDELFQTYCNQVRKEKIVLSRAPDKNPVFAQDIVINYQTRFTSPARQKQNLDGFRAACKKASRRHVKGVFLTLTSNPKGGSLWQINKKTQTAWGKFSKFLGRCLPKRAEWIKVAEFQKNGMLHYHVLIVGINWLLHKSLIQYAWVHYGGGPVLDIHTVKKEVAKDDVLDTLAAAVTAKWVKCMGFSTYPANPKKTLKG
ncbi:rolling circle replication-associated protein [Methanosarcina sp. UBA411]|uniref:rolling circle replication-associated protein n=1 Tax=Methanosarcina sp. UBA411 TaxID=1915589 RepID=UPI003BEEF188